MPDELSKKERRELSKRRNFTLLHMDYEATCIINVPTSYCSLIAVRNDWFKALVALTSELYMTATL